MGWPIWGWFPAEGRHFLLLQNIQPQYGAHLAFCSMGNEVFFPWDKCPHATVWCWSCQWVKLYHFFPCVPSWHAQRQLTLVTSHLQRTLISLCFLYWNLRQCIQERSRVYISPVCWDIDVLQLKHHWLHFDKFSYECSTIGSHHEWVLIKFVLW